ncbi:hypothetical protein Tco_0427632 [Tanacetum coccineum]
MTLTTPNNPSRLFRQPNPTPSPAVNPQPDAPFSAYHQPDASPCRVAVVRRGGGGGRRGVAVGGGVMVITMMVKMVLVVTAVGGRGGGSDEHSDVGGEAVGEVGGAWRCVT